MATEQLGFQIGTETTAASLATSQFFCVKFTSTGFNLCGTAGEPATGILQNKPGSGVVADVMTLGVTKAIASTAITKGAKLMTDSAGKVITAATTGSTVIGWALEAAAATDEVITIYFGGCVGIV